MSPQRGLNPPRSTRTFSHLGGRVQMLRNSDGARCWPSWACVTTTGAAVATTYLLQIPLERDVPGEPFLLFFLVGMGVLGGHGRDACLREERRFFWRSAHHASFGSILRTV